MENYIIYLFLATLAASLLLHIYNFIFASVHDIRSLRKRKEYLKHPNALRFRKRPLVSVVIYAKNDQKFINHCVDSILQNGYKKLEVIIVDNASTDSTYLMVKENIAKYPSKKIRIVCKKIATSRETAVSYAAKKWTTGNYILITDASTILNKGSILTSIRHISEPSTSVVIASIHKHHDNKLLGIANQFANINSIWAKKAGKPGHALGTASNNSAIYANEAFNHLSKPGLISSLSNVNDLYSSLPKSQVKFASDVSVYSYKNELLPKYTDKFKNLSKINKASMLLISMEPVLACFMLLAAFKYDSPGYFLLGWGIYTTILLLSIWSDDSQTIRPKILLTLMSPIAYGLNIVRTMTINAVRTVSYLFAEV
jgi:hypothetical protein